MMDKENKCYQCGGFGCNHCQVQGDSESSVAAGSVAWTSVKEKLPRKKEHVLAYAPRDNPAVAYQTIRWWDCDEQEFSHWAKLEPPKAIERFSSTETWETKL